jgi:hypothetical protein
VTVVSHLPPVRTRTVKGRRVRKLVQGFVLEEEAGGLVEDAGSREPFIGVGRVVPADEEVPAVDGVVGPVGDVVDDEVGFLGEEGWWVGCCGVSEGAGSRDVTFEEVKVEGGVKLAATTAVVLG